MIEFDPNQPYADEQAVRSIVSTFSRAVDRAHDRSQRLEADATWHDLVVLSVDDYDLLLDLLAPRVADDARARVLHEDLSYARSLAPAETPQEPE